MTIDEERNARLAKRVREFRFLLSPKEVLQEEALRLFKQAAEALSGVSVQRHKVEANVDERALMLTITVGTEMVSARLGANGIETGAGSVCAAWDKEEAALVPTDIADGKDATEAVLFTLLQELVLELKPNRAA